MARPAKRFGFMFRNNSGPYSGRRSSSSNSWERFFFIKSAFVTGQEAGTDDPHPGAAFDKGYQSRLIAQTGNELTVFIR